MIYGTRITTFCIAILLSLSFTVSAEQVPELKIFTNGTAANANEVNSNFSTLKETVDNNDLKEGGVVNGPLTVPSITYSAPKSASVTYSAMGFTPETNISFPWYSKNNKDGSLSASDASAFYHSLTLRSGVTITRIQAHVDGGVIVKLKQEGREVALAEIPSSEDTNHQLESASAYYIEVFFSASDQKFYSVTIEYTYTEP